MSGDGYVAHLRPFSELRSTGLLWAINRVLLHPRGYALGLSFPEGSSERDGWVLFGDGSETWSFGDHQADEPEHAAFEATLNDLRLASAHDVALASCDAASFRGDGECSRAECPQIRDGEPARSGRHCPLAQDDPEV